VTQVRREPRLALQGPLDLPRTGDLAGGRLGRWSTL